MDTLDELLARCAEQKHETPTPALRAATGAFLAMVRDRPEGVPTRALEALSQLPPRGAAWLAITFGSAIESGAPPSPSGRAVTELLRGWLEALPIGPDDPEDAPLSDAHYGVVLAMPFLCQSVVAHLARLPTLRRTLGSDRALNDRLARAEAYTHGATWVRGLLYRTSGALVVLHAASRRALALSYQNVGAAFHLFTLLQGAIGTTLPGGREPNRALLSSARGRGHTAEPDEAWWHYQDHRRTEPELIGSIWAESSVDEIPKLDDTLVLVLWPKILGGRHWDAGFFGPTLEAAPPDVKLVRELSPAEAEAWFVRLAISRVASRPT